MVGDADTPSLEARVQELETRFAFAERVSEDLDAVVSDFATRVQRLEAEVVRLKAQLASGVGGDDLVGDPLEP